MVCRSRWQPCLPATSGLATQACLDRAPPAGLPVALHAGASPGGPWPRVLPVLIVNPDNTTFELGIKEQDPYALAGSEGWPGPPGGRDHPLKALRVPPPAAAGAAEADVAGGSPLSVLARQHGYQGFGGGGAGSWPPPPHLAHVQLAQAGLWLPADDDCEAAEAGEPAEHGSCGDAGSSPTTSTCGADGSGGCGASSSSSSVGAGTPDLDEHAAGLHRGAGRQE